MHFVAARLGGAGAITYRKMFGEYSVYRDGKLFGCVCDDRLLVKNTEPGRALMPDGRLEPPYEGGRCSVSNVLKTGTFSKHLCA